MFIKRLFSSSSLPAIRVVSSVYLKLLIFLPAVLILPLVVYGCESRTIKKAEHGRTVVLEKTLEGP